MLTHIAIRNIALIDNLALDFAPGFTALTGETGAGKSLLLDALGLALGARADGGLIRHGESVADVSAIFKPSVTSGLQTLLEEQGLELEPDSAGATLTLRRQLKREEGGSTGSKAWVNGTPVPAGVLAQLATHLVDIHAQHGTQNLLSAAAQRDVLDALGNLHNERAQVQQTHATWQAAKQALQVAEAEFSRALADADLLTAWRKELEDLAYQQGEEEELAAKRSRLQNHAQLNQLLTVADEALSGDAGTLTSLRVAARQVALAARLDGGLQPLAQRLQSALNELEDCAHEAARNMGGEEGPQSLEELDDRLHAIRGAARKHHVEIASLPLVLEKLTRQTSDVGQLQAQVEDLRQEEERTHAAFAGACGALGTARRRNSTEKCTGLNKALKDLQLPDAELTISITQLPENQWNASGSESVELLLAANPGSPAQSITKVASGGELSRLMLAIKRVVYQGLKPQVVVFDEIDTGLSGRASTAVGTAMANLGEYHQVLTITHHPQVAAAAHHHGRISKQVESGKTTTQIKVLSGDERLEELARLLSGNKITPQARAAAQALREESMGKAA